MYNLILQTDSYKLSHGLMLDKDINQIFSYFENRTGGMYPHTLFFGLTPILFKLDESRLIKEDIEETDELVYNHFGPKAKWVKEMFKHIDENLDGKWPLHIKAVPEGTIVPEGNVLMTVTNTDPKCAPLVNMVEDLLTHVWGPSTVATRSYVIKQILKEYLEKTSDDQGGLRFMLHDFGCRSVFNMEQARLAGAAHLVNFYGTDTLPGMRCAIEDYEANKKSIGFSVPASEHNVMMQYGRDGEPKVVENLLNLYPEGILSVVADTYDIHHFVENIVGKTFRDRIKNRKGVFVVRPDSVSPMCPTPETMCVWIAQSLANNFGFIINSKGYKVLHPCVRIIYGDGLTEQNIKNILEHAKNNGFSAENFVFGCGSYLLDKLSRDTQRFAFKTSAMKFGHEWRDVYKEPLGSNKKSKKGLLKLVKDPDGNFITVNESDPRPDELVTVFLNGRIENRPKFEEIRKRAGFC